MLGDIDPQNAPEHADPEQPEIEGDARHKAKEGRERELEVRSFHGLTIRAIEGKREEVVAKHEA